MKKKAIEKIPYLGLPEVSRKKGVKYIGVTACKNIAHERHFFLEVYRNDKNHMKIPVARIVLTKKDFGTYLTDTETWTRAKCLQEWGSRPVWYSGDDSGRYCSRQKIAEENVLYDQEDFERVKKFCGDAVFWSEEMWVNYINQKMDHIAADARNKRLARKLERRQKALEERAAATPEFPERDVLEYAEKCLFHSGHNLYYRKGKTRAEVACSACGGVSSARWRDGESYESRFETHIQEPREGFPGTCPLCKSTGTFIPQGRARHERAVTRHLFLGQKYKETGMIFRYFEIRKEYALELLYVPNVMQMTGARETISACEIARAYFEPGKKMQTDYHKHSCMDGKDFWDDCNLYGMQNITVEAAGIMPETWENMQGTILQYSAMAEYQAAVLKVNAFEYAERYLQTPQIEMLVKLGLTGVVRELLHCHYGIVSDERAERADRFLGIRKEHLKLLTEHHGDTELLEVMQLERQRGLSWTDEQVKNLAELGSIHVSASLLDYMPVQKLLNRVAKYAGCGYGTGCSRTSARLMSTARLYSDYLGMRQQQGYDLANTVYLYPGNLQAAHDRMMLEVHQEEIDKRCREAAEKFPDIKKQYRRLRREFFYGDETYQIRPARSAEEIVVEGRLLHHCVGGDGYLRGHNEGRSIILLLRFQENPDIPYITVEIDRNYRILQWYGAYDKKPDWENVQQWLDAYVTRLKGGAIVNRPDEETDGNAEADAAAAAEQLMLLGA